MATCRCVRKAAPYWHAFNTKPVWRWRHDVAIPTPPQHPQLPHIDPKKSRFHCKLHEGNRRCQSQNEFTSQVDMHSEKKECLDRAKSSDKLGNMLVSKRWGLWVSEWGGCGGVGIYRCSLLSIVLSIFLERQKPSFWAICNCILFIVSTELMICVDSAYFWSDISSQGRRRWTLNDVRFRLPT